MPARMSDTHRPWPIAPRPFLEEAFGSWLGRIAARYQTSVDLIWESGTGVAMPSLTKAGWILFPPVPSATLSRLSRVARLNDGILSMIQTPHEWVFDQKYLVYCFRCLVLNDADVTASRWKREWLDPSADYCRVHHSLLETVPQSIFARAPNFDAALRAISRYRCPPLRLSKTLR
ncbi:conserved hypothetical protein [Burkholderia cenocepacia HI2424]|nr:conserved hypothetical protein [Burkholderia cenocepacia HI2424]